MHIDVELTGREAEVLDQLCQQKELTPEQLLRQALRVYQLVDAGVYILNPEHPLNAPPVGCGNLE